MCLNIKENYLKATEDIVCYKVYIKKYSSVFISPFRNCQQPELNTLQESKNMYSAGLGIHSFASMEGVKRLMFAFGSLISNFTFTFNTLTGFKIVKCIIPKDSYFASGIDEFTKCTAYCSHNLIDVEELDIINSTNWTEKLIQYYEGSRCTSES